MPRQQRIPKTEFGTLPTPANLYPSKQVIKSYKDKTFTIIPGATQAVRAQYEKAITAAPEDAKLRVNYGRALQKTGNFAAAKEQIQTAVRLDPQWPFSHLILGGILEEEGNYDSSIEEYREAIRLLQEENSSTNGPLEASARSRLAEALKQTGNMQEARAELKQAIKITKVLVDRGAGCKDSLRRYLYELSQCG